MPRKPKTAPLPGELEPLSAIPGRRESGQPISDDEALGTARRLARLQAARGRTLSNLAAPDQLPDPDVTTMTAHRLPVRLVFRARTKAELEQRTMTSILVAALEQYAGSPPDWELVAVPPAPEQP